MTRTHAAVQLLAHGPLTFREFVNVTGWTAQAATGALRWLIETDRVQTAPIAGKRLKVYALAGGSNDPLN